MPGNIWNVELTRKYHSPTLTMDGSGENPGIMGLEGDMVGDWRLVTTV